MKKLTNKQVEVYNYICNFKTVNGYAPTIDEIAKGLYTSRSYARECVLSLQDFEYITYNPNKRRSIVVIKF